MGNKLISGLTAATTLEEADLIEISQGGVSKKATISLAERKANKDASGGYVGKTLEKINIYNAARTFLNQIVAAATTAIRTWTFPDKDITVAGTVDISDHAALTTVHAAATNLEKTANKGAVSGYADLDSTTKVPIAQMADGTPDGTKFVRDDRTLVAPSFTPIDASVSRVKLKTSTGTWSIFMSPVTYFSVELVDYSFFPKQKANNSAVLLWGSTGAPIDIERYIIFAYNSNATDAFTWYGTYRYVTASEQIIDLIVNPETQKIIGVHITEKGNEGSMKIYDKNKKEILMENIVFDRSFIEGVKDIEDLKTKAKFLKEVEKRGLKLAEKENERKT